ncbi:MAG: hypothetical protein QXL00_01490 [Conexivisphaerales archaeon]
MDRVKLLLINQFGQTGYAGNVYNAACKVSYKAIDKLYHDDSYSQPA